MTNVVDLPKKKPSTALQDQRASILGQVLVLLTHYYMPDLPEEIREAQANDWFEDLAEFGPGVVEVACRQWRRMESWRPTPADIRDLANRELRRRQHEEQRQRMRLIELRRNQLADHWSRERGFDGFAEARRYGRDLSDIFGANWHRAASVEEVEAAAAAVAVSAPPPSSKEAAEEREAERQEHPEDNLHDEALQMFEAARRAVESVRAVDA